MAQLKAGGLIVLYDERRDQGDLLAAAQLTTSSIITQMVHHGGGLVCVALTPARARELGLRRLPVRRAGGSPPSERTPTMVSVEARVGVSTGISSSDRAETVGRLAGPSTGPRDLVSPGHVFPLVAAGGGLLECHGRLQAAVDIVRLAGLQPAATLCDILDDRGDLAGRDELGALARDLDIPFISIGELADDRCDDVWSRC
jgi:3,4-dihydroxy 2-butanone 4-phosphate synthase/GTP cyclohydrolase II